MLFEAEKKKKLKRKKKDEIGIKEIHPSNTDFPRLPSFLFKTFFFFLILRPRVLYASVNSLPTAETCFSPHHSIS